MFCLKKFNKKKKKNNKILDYSFYFRYSFYFNLFNDSYKLHRAKINFFFILIEIIINSFESLPEDQLLYSILLILGIFVI